MLKVSPTVNITPEGDFDFSPGIKLDLPDFANKEPMELIAALLPGPVSCREMKGTGTYAGSNVLGVMQVGG